MQPERDDEKQSEERFGQHRRTEQEERWLEEEQRDCQLCAVEFYLLREAKRLPRCRQADGDSEEFGRRVAESRRKKVEQGKERARPDADEIMRMAMRPTGEQVMVTGILLVGVRVEPNQRDADYRKD